MGDGNYEAAPAMFATKAAGGKLERGRPRPREYGSGVAAAPSKLKRTRLRYFLVCSRPSVSFIVTLGHPLAGQGYSSIGYSPVTWLETIRYLAGQGVAVDS